MGPGVLDREEAAHRIDTIDVHPLVDALLEERRIGPGDADIGEEHLEPAKLADAAANDLGDVVFDGSVGDHAQRNAAFGFDRLHGLVRVGGAPDHQNGRALAREAERARLPDPAAAAGDDRAPAFEPLQRQLSYLAGTVQPPSAVTMAPCR